MEGETLAGRLARGRLPLDEALAIAREIVDAVEAAHEKGIIHRDLKPSNIALTADGHVKVLDFGLAKAMEPQGLLSSADHLAMTHSPTLTFAATQAGVILGTAAYMSPEQAKGRVADKRSDVWAFGCVLFEMLAGKRAFEGEDISDTMAAVLRGEPGWDGLPPTVPPSIRSLLKRCLDKDRRARIPEMSVVRFLMEDASAPAPAAPMMPSDVTATVARRAMPWAVAGAAAVMAAVAVVMWAPWRAPAQRATIRLDAQLGADASLRTDLGAGAVLSPDGTLLVFAAAAGNGDRSQLYVRRLDQLQAAPLAGTDDATGPFFSPDGQWVAFFGGGRLKKVAVTGGAAVTLTDAASPRGGVWAPDDTIVFAPTATAGLSRVSSAGGTAAPATMLGENENSHRWPEVLPWGGILFTVSSGAGFSAEGASLVVQDGSGARKTLVRGGYYGRYVRSWHVVYLNNGTLFAAPFDARRLELTGQGVPVLEAITNSTANGSSQIAVSASGTAVFLPGQTLDNDAPMSWMDRAGKTTPLRATPANWSNPSFAPDGGRVAIDITDGTQADVWIYEWARDTLSRLTFDGTDDQRPAWTPDGRRIAFVSKRGDKSTFNVYWQRSDGTGDVQRLTESKNQQMTGSWHPSGKFFAFSEATSGNSSDLMILPMEGDETTGWKPGSPTAFLQTPQNEGSPMFSPDGRWIAYLSNETGRTEVFVRPFPDPGGKWQISTGAADDPTWSRARRELLFASTPDLRLMVAPYTVDGDSFRADKPRLLSDSRFVTRPRPPSRDLDLHPDGERVAVAASAEPQAATVLDKVVFVFNFADELRRVARSTN